MKITRRALSAGAFGLTTTALLGGQAQATESKISDELLDRVDFWTALEAYTFAYPLVTMEYTRRVMTNVTEAKGTRAPVGQIGRLRAYPDASFTDVTAPNADTLYTYAFFDVTKEPYVVSVPDMNDRYALFPMLSGWTDVFDVPGSRAFRDASHGRELQIPVFKPESCTSASVRIVLKN